MYERYFKILEVDQNISLAELKSVFRRKAIQFHPDKNNSKDAHENFILIKEAYDKIQLFLNASQKNEEFINYNQNQPSSYQRKSHEYKNYNYHYKNKPTSSGSNRIQKQTLADKIATLFLSLLGIALISSPIINYNDLHSQFSKYIESSIVGFIIGMLLLTFSVLSLKK
jgi:DnaJ-class molecular chaperone